MSVNQRANRDVFRKDVQGLRALALLMVLSFHGGLPTPGGFAGVDVFFVISGFVITLTVIRDVDLGRFSIRTFYSKRFKRLAPPLALMVGCVVLISIFFISPLGGIQTAVKTAFGSIFFLANYIIFRITGGYFDAPAHSNPFLHTWSLSVEEQFYLVYPVLIAVVFFFQKKFHKFKLLLPVVTIFSAVSFLSAVFWPEVSNIKRADFFFQFYGPVGRVWEFGAGALVAVLFSSALRVSRRSATVMGCLGLAMLMFTMLRLDETFKFPGAWTLLPVFGSVLLLIAGQDPGNFVSRWLSASVLVGLGDRSYSIYLWHWPFVVFASLRWSDSPTVAPVIATAISVIPALLAYHFLEQRLRKREMSPRRIVRRLVPAVVLPLVILLGFAKVATDKGFWNQEVQSIQDSALQRHIGSLSDCDHMAPLSEVVLATCDFNSVASGPRIYLLGDSNADHFSEGVIAAGETLNRPVTLRTANACPFSLLRVDLGHGDSWSESCTLFTTQSLQFLSTAEPSTVVISNTDSYWTVPTVKINQVGGLPIADPQSKLKLLGEQTAKIVTEIQQYGHQVVLVQVIPQVGFDPAQCTTFTVLARKCNATMDRQEVESQQASTREVIQAVGLETGAAIFDPFDYMCSELFCSAAGTNLFRFKDSNHISVPQSEALAEGFANAVNN